jgi:hypothetical protein
MKNISYNLPLPDDKADVFITAFAMCNGWHDKHEKTALEFGKGVIDAFIKNQVTSYLANKEADLKRQQTLEAYSQQLSQITSTIEVE